MTITLSPTEQPGVFRGDDGSWWWEPSNGEPPFQLPPPEPKPSGDPKPEGDTKLENDSDADESTAGTSQDHDEGSDMYVDLLLIDFLMEEDCSIEEAIEAVKSANSPRVRSLALRKVALDQARLRGQFSVRTS